jgi:hypothetical protein
MAEWISVKDRFPPESEIVLVYAPPTGSTGCRQLHIGRWDSSTHKWFSQYGDVESTRDWFTYWMPLPEPPEQGDLINALEILADLEVYQEEIARQLAQQIGEEINGLLSQHIEQIVAAAIKEAVK